VPALVIIEEQRISNRLREKPELGPLRDVCFRVVVVKTNDVSGGGVIVAAASLDGASSACPPSRQNTTAIE